MRSKFWKLLLKLISHCSAYRPKTTRIGLTTNRQSEGNRCIARAYTPLTSAANYTVEELGARSASSAPQVSEGRDSHIYLRYIGAIYFNWFFQSFLLFGNISYSSTYPASKYTCWSSIYCWSWYDSLEQLIHQLLFSICHYLNPHIHNN